ncbi:MAG: hypothetical protein MUF81_15280 [Verrucomicrobia bacterium]|nr:hypothetical protein [Verrucomicrobiota bacterium]
MFLGKFRQSDCLWQSVNRRVGVRFKDVHHETLACLSHDGEVREEWLRDVAHFTEPAERPIATIHVAQPTDKILLLYFINEQSRFPCVQLSMPSSIGQFGWYGAVTTYCQVDPKEKIVAIAFAPHFPFNEHNFFAAFQTAYYQALKKGVAEL